MAQSKEMTSGRSLPLIFNFTLPLLLGNLLQQTYSLVDAAIVGKFLGINALASVGASTSVVFLFGGIPDTGVLQRMLRRLRYPRGTEVRCKRLCHDAPLRICKPENSRSHVGGDNRHYQFALRLHPTKHANS